MNATQLYTTLCGNSYPGATITLRLKFGARQWTLDQNIWPPRVRFTRDDVAKIEDNIQS